MKSSNPQNADDKRCRKCGVAMPDAILPEPICTPCFEKQERRAHILGCLGSTALFVAIAAALWFGGNWFFDWFRQYTRGQSGFAVVLQVAAGIGVLGLISLGGSALATADENESPAKKVLTQLGFSLIGMAALMAVVATLGLIIP